MDPCTLVTGINGTKFLAALDRASLLITDAFWIFDNQLLEWRFIAASKFAQRKGVYEAISRVFDDPALRKKFTIEFLVDRFLLTAPKDPRTLTVKSFAGHIDDPKGVVMTLPLEVFYGRRAIVYRT